MLGGLGGNARAMVVQVSCFRHLEVNVFPAVLYKLDLHLRRGLAESVMRYFKIEVQPAVVVALKYCTWVRTSEEAR